MSEELNLGVKDDFSALSVAELKKLVSRRGLGGSWTVNASKLEFIACLESGTLPVRATENSSNGNGGGDLVRQIAEAVAPFVSGSVKREEVEAIVDERMASFKPTTTEIVVKRHETGESINVGVQHRLFPSLLAFCNARVNVWLSGPAGSGKTTAAAAVAKALGMAFYFNGAIDSPHKLMGYQDAQGRYVSTAFRKAYEGGGVYLFDEIDASMPAALLAFNAALANGHCDFPDGTVQKCVDFICVAGGNSWNGATCEYVGRMKQDAAFMDRFAFLAWPYDEELEKAISGNDQWTERVQGWRKKALEKGLKVVISPRASIAGSLLLAAGVDSDIVIETVVKKSMSADQWNAIQ